MAIRRLQRPNQFHVRAIVIIFRSNYLSWVVVHSWVVLLVVAKKCRNVITASVTVRFEATNPIVSAMWRQKKCVGKIVQFNQVYSTWDSIHHCLTCDELFLLGAPFFSLLCQRETNDLYNWNEIRNSNSCSDTENNRERSFFNLQKIIYFSAPTIYIGHSG